MREGCGRGLDYLWWKMLLVIMWVIPICRGFQGKESYPRRCSRHQQCTSTSLVSHPRSNHGSRILRSPFPLYSATVSNNKQVVDSQYQDDDDDDTVEFIQSFIHSFEDDWRILSGPALVQKYFVSSMIDDDDNDDDNDESNTPTPFWRDMVAYTWDIRTMEGKDAISSMLDRDGLRIARSRTSFEITNRPLPPQQKLRYDDDDDDEDNHQDEIIEFWANLKVDEVGSGKAHFKLWRSTTTTPGEFKIHTMLTTLLELANRPFRVGANRIRGHQPGSIANRQYFSERLQTNEDSSPHVIIIGGGQAGLSLGARLHLMDVPYVILEAGEKPGMAWRKRYPSLHLHDPVWYNHMPYLPFPESWPVFCPRDKIADWLEFYAKALDLNVQTQSRVTQVEQLDPSGGERGWRVMVASKDEKSGEIKSHTLLAPHVVFATGNSSKPRVPKIPGLFMGLQIHSSQYRGGRNYREKRVVVVGSNNSGWDIVQDLWEQGAKHVTMIQRSPSMVVSTQSVLTHGLGALYRQDAPVPHEDADLIATSVPYKLMIPRWKAVTKLMQETDKELLDSLSVAGYQLEDGPDGAGIFAKSATEGGGFYIDMGCAELIIQGKVDVRYATVERLESDGIVIRDQETKAEDSLPADVIVYATGFESMDQWVAELCGKKVATDIGRTWGLGYGKRPKKDPGPWEGELRNMWKPTRRQGLWFHGGNLAQSRHYSRFLALQLAARFIKLETPALEEEDRQTNK